MFFSKVNSQHFFEAEAYVVRRNARAEYKAIRREVEKELKTQLRAVRRGEILRKDVLVRITIDDVFPLNYQKELNKRGFLVQHEVSEDSPKPKDYTFVIRLGYSSSIPSGLIRLG